MHFGGYFKKIYSIRTNFLCNTQKVCCNTLQSTRLFNPPSRLFDSTFRCHYKAQSGAKAYYYTGLDWFSWHSPRKSGLHWRFERAELRWIFLNSRGNRFFQSPNQAQNTKFSWKIEMIFAQCESDGRYWERVSSSYIILHSILPRTMKDLLKYRTILYIARRTYSSLIVKLVKNIIYIQKYRNYENKFVQRAPITCARIPIQ